MLSDLNDGITEEEDAMVTNCTCPHCGASYEITDTPECEKHRYPYWK